MPALRGPVDSLGSAMRLGLQARFILIFVLAGALAVVAVLALHAQLRAHDDAVAAAVRTLAAPTAASDAPIQAYARIDLADRQLRRDLAVTLLALGLLLTGLALWVWHGLLQPLLAVARAARRIEAGENVCPLAMAQREDEIGDIASAFATLDDAIGALRERMHHDADLAPRPGAGPAPVVREAMVPAAVVPAAPVAGLPVAVPAPAAIVPAPVPAPTAEQIERLRRLEDDLHDAWRRGELHVLYQPIHSLADGRMRGAEALLRWEHPVEGAVSPAEFVPLAERSDLILELGRQVLVQACADASLWPGDGSSENSPFISVNVAPAQLLDQKLFEYVVEALRTSGLAAARLHLEVPAQALRDNDPVVDAMVEQLRGLGLQIWVDATGVDATDQRKWMRPSVSGVKVGQGRIRGRQDNTAEASSTDAIVASARALRIVAVVVGVEQLAELNVLKEQGADLAQGYVLCKPVGTAEIGRRLLA